MCFCRGTGGNAVRRRPLLVLANVLLLVVTSVGAASAHTNYDIPSYLIPSSKFTNGTVKYVTGSMAHNHCGKYSDVSFRVYYDRLSTSGMHITKVVVTYKLKAGSGSGMWGGSLIVTHGTNDQDYVGSIVGDRHEAYFWKSSTRDSEGYSNLGSYTHPGPVTINGRDFFLTKYTSIFACATQDVSVLKWRW
jgi:hypothetical protein